MNYDAIVIGAGHAGVEAALALARTNHKTVIMTINLDAIAFLACNPSIGGTAKGHLVREIDALGGQMGITADQALLQIRMLNLAKGPAVHSLRGQADKQLYHNLMKRTLEEEPNLTVVQQEATELIVENGEVCGVKTSMGIEYRAKAVVLCSGVYLRSRIIIGDFTKHTGPNGFEPANQLTDSLISNGLSIMRFKTGTPARVDSNTIDYSKMIPQYGDDGISSFSFMTKEKILNTRPCYLCYTNEKTHDIIRANIGRSPLYNGSIHGVGPRYCPSIEDKVMRFADKERHQIFIEPESDSTNEMYVQGMSSSLPYDVQIAMYRTIEGMENVQLMRFAYAIEYDCLDSTELYPTLMSKKVKGLFTAGQVNGSSGYEEAAAQGLIAGINASRYIDDLDMLVLERNQAYIGVLIDDLVTKGTHEPYRMMTARAEHRLYLRQDNADKRLTAIGYAMGLATKERYDMMTEKYRETDELLELSKRYVSPKLIEGLFETKGEVIPKSGITIGEIVKRQSMRLSDLVGIIDELADYSSEAIEEAEIELKYSGYLLKEEQAIKEAKKLESKLLAEDIDYMAMEGLRIEARQKLDKIRPLNLGQASRICGVSPADINVLIIYLQKNNI